MTSWENGGWTRAAKLWNGKVNNDWAADNLSWHCHVMCCHVRAALKCTRGYCCKCSNPGYLLRERFNGQPLLVCWPQMINGVVSHHAILNLHLPLPPVCLGTGWCEEGIHKNGGQILPAAETGRAAQDGHGQSHKPVFVQGGDGDDCFFLPSDQSHHQNITKHKWTENQKPVIHGHRWHKQESLTFYYWCL